MIYFELPDSPKTRQLNYIVLQLIRSNPNWFVDDLVIEAVYGCPSVCIWNGGCINFEQKRLPPLEIKKIVENYNKLGVGYRLTFTNRLLEKRHLDDPLGNEQLQLCYNNKNAVIVANDFLEDYIKNNYPKYEIIQSVCRVYETDEEINIHSRNTLLCLPIRYNNMWNKLTGLENRNNLLVIVNEFCPNPYCAHFKEHYESDNMYTLGLATRPMECVYKSIGKKSIEKNESLSHHIIQDFYSIYERIGISHFKINGRGRTINRLLPEYSRYLVKDSFKDTFTIKVTEALSNI